MDALGQALLAAAPPPPSRLTDEVMGTIRAEALRRPLLPPPRQRVGGRWPAIWLRLAVAALALCLPLGAVLAHASDATLPGDMLYPMRTARESLSLALAPDPAAHDALAVGLAQARVADLHEALARHADADVIQGVVDSMIEYNRGVSPAMTPWLRDALTNQYQAVDRARRSVAHDASWPARVARPAVVQALDRGLGGLRALARAAGAPWAQSGPDIPPHGPAPDTGP